MHVKDALKARRSTRSFQNKAVAEELISTLLASALAAPSWCNVQAYKVALAQGEQRDRLAQALCRKWDMAVRVKAMNPMGKALALTRHRVLPDGDFNVEFKQYPQTFRRRRQACGHGLYTSLGIDRHDRGARDAQIRRNFEFFGAPVVLFLFVHKSAREYGILDAGIFLQSLMLRAQELGLASCAQGALATWRSPVAKEFTIPEGYQLLCGMALGYASDAEVNRFSPKRMTVDELLIV